MRVPRRKLSKCSSFQENVLSTSLNLIMLWVMTSHNVCLEFLSSFILPLGWLMHFGYLRAELSWTPMGYVVRQTLSTERSAAPKNVTSVINRETLASSADPRSVSTSPPEVLSSDPSCKEKHVHSATKVRVVLAYVGLLCPWVVCLSQILTKCCILCCSRYCESVVLVS